MNLQHSRPIETKIDNMEWIWKATAHQFALYIVQTASVIYFLYFLKISYKVERNFAYRSDESDVYTCGIS